MTRWFPFSAAASLLLVGCVTTSSSVDYVAYDEWDYAFRNGIYDDDYYNRGDIDIDRGDWPDRPRPPIADNPRPVQPIYRPVGGTRPSASGGYSGRAGSLRGGGGRGGGGGRRR